MRNSNKQFYWRKYLKLSFWFYRDLNLFLIIIAKYTQNVITFYSRECEFWFSSRSRIKVHSLLLLLYIHLKIIRFQGGIKISQFNSFEFKEQTTFETSCMNTQYSRTPVILPYLTNNNYANRQPVRYSFRQLQRRLRALSIKNTFSITVQYFKTHACKCAVFSFRTYTFARNEKTIRLIASCASGISEPVCKRNQVYTVA